MERPAVPYALGILLACAIGCAGSPPCDGEIVEPGGCPEECDAVAARRLDRDASCLGPARELCYPYDADGDREGCLYSREPGAIYAIDGEITPRDLLLDAYRPCKDGEADAVRAARGRYCP